MTKREVVFLLVLLVGMGVMTQACRDRGVVAQDGKEGVVEGGEDNVAPVTSNCPYCGRENGSVQLHLCRPWLKDESCWDWNDKWTMFRGEDGEVHFMRHLNEVTLFTDQYGVLWVTCDGKVNLHKDFMERSRLKIEDE